MLVRALRFGVDHMGGGREPGAEWDHPGPIGSWMEVVSAEGVSPPPSEAPEQNDVSEADAPAPEAKRQMRNRKPKES